MSQSLSNDMLDLLREFSKNKVEFILVGGHAVNLYTDPRATKDVDILINPTTENANKVYAALLEFGAPVTSATPADFCDGESFFIIGVNPNRVDILQRIPGVEFQESYKRCEKVSLAGVEIFVLGIDDLIRAKLAAGRKQDLADVEKLQIAKKSRQT